MLNGSKLSKFPTSPLIIRVPFLLLLALNTGTEKEKGQKGSTGEPSFKPERRPKVPQPPTHRHKILARRLPAANNELNQAREAEPPPVEGSGGFRVSLFFEVQRPFLLAASARLMSYRV